MIVFDTSILIYAAGTEHPLRDPCREAWALVGDGKLQATTTVEVIQEFTHVRSRRRTRDNAATLAKACALALQPLLVLDEMDLMDGLARYRRSRTLGAFDSVLAAAAVRAGFRLASADKAFRHLRDLDHLDPADPGFLDDILKPG